MPFLQNTAICLKENNAGVYVTFLVHKVCYAKAVRSD